MGPGVECGSLLQGRAAASCQQQQHCALGYCPAGRCRCRCQGPASATSMSAGMACMRFCVRGCKRVAMCSCFILPIFRAVVDTMPIGWACWPTAVQVSHQLSIHSCCYQMPNHSCYSSTSAYHQPTSLDNRHPCSASIWWQHCKHGHCRQQLHNATRLVTPSDCSVLHNALHDGLLHGCVLVCPEATSAHAVTVEHAGPHGAHPMYPGWQRIDCCLRLLVWWRAFLIW